MSKNPAVWLLAGIAISLLILGIRVIAQKDQYVTVEIIASGGNWWETIPGVPDWLGDAVTLGLVEYSAGGKKLVEILDTRNYNEEQNRVLWIKARLLVTPDKNTGGWRFRQMPLQIGSTITIQPNNIKLTGSVVAVEELENTEEYKNIIITVRLYYRFPWYAEEIMPGEKYTAAHDRVIAEVLSKKVDLAETVVHTADGRAVEQKDPLKRDITLTLKIEVEDRGDNLYFNQIQPVKIGQSLWIPFKRINLTEAIVMNIEEI